MGHKSNGILAGRLMGKLCQDGGVNMAGGVGWGDGGLQLGQRIAA